MSKLISVIIVTYNSDELIDDCLHSLEDFNDIGEQLEVIIVDNCSKNSHSFLNRINSLYPTVKTFLNNSNAGYGSGNNLGISKATAPIIMIMNPDVRLKEPIFKKTLNKFSSDSSMKILGMKQWKDAFSKSESFYYDCLKSDFYTLFIDKVLNKFDYFSPRKHYISGACFFLKKKEFVEIGMFDEQIFLYGEEVDIKRRMQDKYGINSYRYGADLNYIHLIQGRISSLNSFVYLIQSLQYLCHKFGYDFRSCLKRQRRILYFLLYWNKIIGNRDKALLFRNCINEFTINIYQKS